MTAKEWLKKETGDYLELYHDCMYENITYNDAEDKISLYMERYANEVSKEYQAKILMFREQLIDLVYKEDRYTLASLLEGDPNTLTEGQLKYIEIKRLLQEMQKNPIIVNYDKWFGITKQTKGEIVNGS